LKVFKNNYFKNLFSLAGSEIISQSILIGVTPILTRIYSPLEFGQYEFFKTSALFLVVIGFLSYDASVYSSKNNIERINSILVSALVLTVICLLASLLLFFFNDYFVTQTGSEIKESWFWTLPLYAFFSALTNLMLVVLTKNGSFKLLSVIKIIVSIFIASTQLLFGWLNMGYWGLVYSTIFVQFIAFIIYFKPFYKELKYSLNECSLLEMKKLLVAYWRLPMLILPGNFFNYLVQSLPVFFFGKIDNQLLGYFSLAKRIIDFPLTFLSSAIQRLYVKNLTDEIENTGIGRYTFLKNLKINGIIALFLLLGVFTLTNLLLPFFFGNEWVPAVPIIIILSILFSIRFVFGSLSFILIFGKAPKFAFLWQFCYAFFLFTFLYILSYLHIDSFWIFVSYVIIGVIFYLIYGFICYKVSSSKKYLTLNKN
jgi:O-antigen/teichoic acid export membrane protein